MQVYCRLISRLCTNGLRTTTTPSKTKKIEVLRHGSDGILKISTNYTSPNGTNDKKHLRDLGVTMSADGTFQHHIINACQSACNMCSWIMKTFGWELQSSCLYFGNIYLVVPILDCCSQLWSVGENQQIEEILYKMIIASAWKTHRLYSLERRRECYRIIYTWKMIETDTSC